jgi:hypothetical protein
VSQTLHDPRPKAWPSCPPPPPRHSLIGGVVRCYGGSRGLPRVGVHAVVSTWVIGGHWGTRNFSPSLSPDGGFARCVGSGLRCMVTGELSPTHFALALRSCSINRVCLGVGLRLGGSSECLPPWLCAPPCSGA